MKLRGGGRRLAGTFLDWRDDGLHPFHPSSQRDNAFDFRGWLFFALFNLIIELILVLNCLWITPAFIQLFCRILPCSVLYVPKISCVRVLCVGCGCAVCGCCVWFVGALCAGAVCGVRFRSNLIVSFSILWYLSFECPRLAYLDEKVRNISIEVLSQKRGP